MNSQIHSYVYPSGELQRVQLVRLDNWNDLEILHPVPSDRALDRFAEVYRKFLVPAAPWVFGSLVLFRIPDGMELPFSRNCGAYGTVADPLTAAAVALGKGVKILGKKVFFRNRQVQAFWKTLKKQDCIRIVRGLLPITTVIPVGNEAGFLTESEHDAIMKVNCSFFTMDPFDCATPYDHIGRPFGLVVKDGCVMQPPLFSREALMVYRDGSVRVERPELKNLVIRIGDRTYVPGKNCRIYSRPEFAWTPSGKGKRLVILGRRVEAVREGGCVPVPGAGFVLCADEETDILPGASVEYEGMEHIRFGIQVGNSIVRDGIKTKKFRSRFFNIKGIQRIAYPPCLYPLDFQKARAARIAIGADSGGKPMILWAEGAAKIGYVPGAGSCGASLSDMARICAELGMVNAVNLDGGGSAQLLWNQIRSLQISDRNADGTEAERPVPLGLMVK